MYDALLVAGPLLVGLVFLAGRNGVTMTLAAGYVAAFAGYTAYKLVSAASRPG